MRLKTASEIAELRRWEYQCRNRLPELAGSHPWVVKKRRRMQNAAEIVRLERTALLAQYLEQRARRLH
jgi:hypothetical protein